MQEFSDWIMPFLRLLFEWTLRTRHYVLCPDSDGQLNVDGLLLRTPAGAQNPSACDGSCTTQQGLAANFLGFFSSHASTA